MAASNALSALSAPPARARLSDCGINGDNLPAIVLETHAGRKLSCRLLGISSGELHATSDLPVAESTKVLIRLSQIELEGQIKYCVAKKDGYRVAVDLNGSGGERAEPRFPMTDSCVAVSLDRPTARLEGNLADYSRSGLGAKLNGRCGIGEMILFQARNLIIVGEVRHCSRDGEAFSIGLSVTDILADRHKTISLRGWFHCRHKIAEWVLGRQILSWR